MTDRPPEPAAASGRSGDEDPQASRLSRFLALVLRHRAYQFELPIDDEGFVPLEPLLNLVHERQGLEEVEREDLEKLTETPGRKRFEIRNNRMRATYGHSFHKPIRYEETTPPEALYLAVPRAQKASVRVQGLRPEGRQYIHLSENREEALEVGQRHSADPAVIEVRARDASEHGIPFYRPADGLYLAVQIPAKFLELEASFGRKPRRSHRR